MWISSGVSCARLNNWFNRGISFFGADHTLFASDCPFDKEKGPGYIRSTKEAIEAVGLSNADKEKIYHKNAERLFGLN